MILFILIFQSSCLSNNLTTNTRSSNIKNHNEKIKFIKKYINCPTQVLDAEQHIIYQDNSADRVPEPSDWEITAVIKVNKKDINEWITDLEEIKKEEIDMTWWNELNLDNFDLSGSVLYYQNPTNEKSYIAVYIDQGILLKYFYT